jgi:hypothetical protein
MTFVSPIFAFIPIVRVPARPRSIKAARIISTKLSHLCHPLASCESSWPKVHGIILIFRLALSASSQGTELAHGIR